MNNKNKALSLLSDKLLAQTAQDTLANFGRKKHDAGTLLKLLIFSHLTHDNVSLRGVVADYSSPFFVALFKGSPLHMGTIGKSTIADFISQLPTEFLENIFSDMVEKYRKVLFKKSKNNIVRFDSTFTSLSKKLLFCGTIKESKSKKRQVKATATYRDIPEAIDFYFEKNQSDAKPLRKAILEYPYLPNDIAVFDRGMQTRKTYMEMEDMGISFVSRLYTKPLYRTLETLEVAETKSGKLTILSDVRAQLCIGGKHWIDKDFRVIETVHENKGKINFVTNCWDLSAGQVCETYKARWDIEIFFKYLKSYLNGRHFLSRSENGIKNVYYIRLIAAILVTLVAKMYNLTGFKQAKRLVWNMLQAYALKRPIGLTLGRGPPIFGCLNQARNGGQLHG